MITSMFAVLSVLSWLKGSMFAVLSVLSWDNTGRGGVVSSQPIKRLGQHTHTPGRARENEGLTER